MIRTHYSLTYQVSDNDRNVVEFYGSQAETYAVYLSNAIDAFILTIEHNQPPKVFVAYSKFVILNAHKLLCIGDTVHRNVGNAKLKASVLERSNQLCQVCFVLFFEESWLKPLKCRLESLLNLTLWPFTITRDCRRAFRVLKEQEESSQVWLPFKGCSTLLWPYRNWRRTWKPV